MKKDGRQNQNSTQTLSVQEDNQSEQLIYQANVIALIRLLWVYLQTNKKDKEMDRGRVKEKIKQRKLNMQQ